MEWSTLLSWHFSFTQCRMHPATIASSERACHEIHRTTGMRNAVHHMLLYTHYWLTAQQWNWKKRQQFLLKSWLTAVALKNKSLQYLHISSRCTSTTLHMYSTSIYFGNMLSYGANNLSLFMFQSKPFANLHHQLTLA